jgi:hypothetical protein
MSFEDAKSFRNRPSALEQSGSSSARSISRSQRSRLLALWETAHAACALPMAGRLLLAVAAS